MGTAEKSSSVQIIQSRVGGRNTGKKHVRSKEAKGRKKETRTKATNMKTSKNNNWGGGSLVSTGGWL